MFSLRLSLSTVCALTFSLASAGTIACSPADSPAGDGDGDGDAAGGTTGDGDATGGTTGDGDSANELPADMTQAGIEAFLAAQTYRSAPWIGDAAVRDTDSIIVAHGHELRVFFNSAAVEAKTSNTTNASTGTMIVKELYSAGDLVGHAVNIKTGQGSSMNDWTFYCSAPENSNICTGNTSSETYFGTGLTECGFCHGEVPIAPLPQ